jgi:dolichol kinase
MVHLLAGACALSLKWLSVPAAALIAALAVVFNFLVLPRVGGKVLFRQGERQNPLESGIHLYPVAVLLLILLFGRRMEVVVAAWLIMAAGDPAARMAGKAFGRRRLP